MSEIVEQIVQLHDFPMYAVSNLGYIQNISSGKKLKPSRNTNGAPCVTLRREGKAYLRDVSRLIAEEFLPGYEADKNESNWPRNTPIHLDHDKLNCHIDNLKWVPRWVAIKWEQEWHDGPTDHRPVTDMRTAKEYPTAWHCGHSVGLLERQVLNHANNWNMPDPIFQFVGMRYKTMEEVRGY